MFPKLSQLKKLTFPWVNRFEINFQQIIFDYPTSKYAQAAMRELFSLEEFENNDYVALKSYYNSNSNIQSNPEFIGLTFQLQKLLSIEKQL